MLCQTILAALAMNMSIRKRFGWASNRLFLRVRIDGNKKKEFSEKKEHLTYALLATCGIPYFLQSLPTPTRSSGARGAKTLTVVSTAAIFSAPRLAIASSTLRQHFVSCHFIKP